MTLAILDIANTMAIIENVLKIRWVMIDGERYLYYKHLKRNPSDGCFIIMEETYPENMILNYAFTEGAL